MRQFGKVEIPQSAFINVLKTCILDSWRGGRVAEGARLESV